MVLKHPIIYVTIPLALALGLIWFRRKKVNCDSGGAKKSSSDLKKTASNSNILQTNEAHDKRVDLKHSISLPIGSTPKKFNSPALNNNDSFDFKFGKSAPIDITPHKTSPTRKSDSGEKEKLEVLNSIEENSLDSVDLPGSVSCRRRFSFTIKTNEPPVVVKASTMDVNKSPQSSFETLTTSPPISENAVENVRSTTKGKIMKTEKKTKNEKQLNGDGGIDQSSNDQNDNKKTGRSLPVASPPLSLCSNKSLDSGDSGKGSSPPNSEGGQTLSSISTYDFQLIQAMVGFIVGKNGTTVKKIRDDCNVNIIIRRHPFNPKKYKLCTIQGTQEQIDKALAMIKNKLPPKVSLDRVDLELESAEMLASIANIDFRSQLNLIDGINNDVSVCSVISGGHLFVQQPLHPTYPDLNRLQNYMNENCSTFKSPVLPRFEPTTICIGHIDGHYYRLQIVEHFPDKSACFAKYLDYGGYCEIQTHELKQIRTDLLSVPFQAIECLLANIRPKGGEWSIQATQAVEELTQYRTLQAQIAGYSESGLPEIVLYSILSSDNVVDINQELVARGLAEWSTPVEA